MKLNLSLDLDEDPDGVTRFKIYYKFEKKI